MASVGRRGMMNFMETRQGTSVPNALAADGDHGSQKETDIRQGEYTLNFQVGGSLKPDVGRRVAHGGSLSGGPN